MLRQIIEDNKQSIVYCLTEPDFKEPILFFSEDDGPTINLATTTGFFVEPDKIVTTIDALSKAFNIAAFSAVSFQKAFSNRRTRTSRKRNRNQVLKPNEDVLEAYTIEGVTAYDTKNNLLLLKIEETGVPLPLGDSETVEIGETVYAIGKQDEPRCTGAAGYLQGRYRDDKWLHIRIHFFGAGSGGPVLNSKQEVIGVFAYATGSAAGGSRSMMGIAITSSVLKELIANSGEVIELDEFQEHPRVRAYALEARADEKMSERNRNRGAIRDYNAALKLNPDLVEIYSKRGIVKLRIRKFRSAIKDFDNLKFRRSSPCRYTNNFSCSDQRKSSCKSDRWCRRVPQGLRLALMALMVPVISYLLWLAILYLQGPHSQQRQPTKKDRLRRHTRVIKPGKHLFNIIGASLQKYTFIFITVNYT